MPRKNKQHDKQFKLDAIHYVKEHPDLTQAECAKNLGVSITTLTRWLSQYKEHDGDIPVRGSGNYQPWQKSLPNTNPNMASCKSRQTIQMYRKQQE